MSTAAARAWWVTNHLEGGWQQHWDLQTTLTRGCRGSVRPRVLGYVFDLPASIASSDGQTDRGWLGVTPSELCLLLVRHSTATARLGGFDMSRYWAASRVNILRCRVLSKLKTVWGHFMRLRNVISCSFLLSGT